ncbi:MAG: alanine racemase [Candidatus Dormibacteraceae bacterium]
MLPADMLAALAALDGQPLSATDKGIPASFHGSIADVSGQNWRILDQTLPLPALVLNKSALDHNIALMQHYCETNGAWLAPHGKTTMAPQLFARQLQAGAWAITVATVGQLQVCRVFNIPRVLIANELVAEYDIRYIGEEMRRDVRFEPYVLVDSLAGVERLGRLLTDVDAGRPLPVLIEVGMRGGRAGVRDADELEPIARAILEHPALRLAGVEGYEGIAPGANLSDREVAAERYLEDVAAATRLLYVTAGKPQSFLVSAGGSVFFDRVVEILGRKAIPEAQLVLRSGGYVTHDSEFYDVQSPFGSRSPRRLPGEPFQPALEVWAVLISRPEPGLCILAMGRRDVPTDVGLPTPRLVSRGGSAPTPLTPECEVTAINDQHAYLRVPSSADLQVGDLIGCGISHPCSAFDRWRTMLTVDSERRVIGAIRTFF